MGILFVIGLGALCIYSVWLYWRGRTELDE